MPVSYADSDTVAVLVQVNVYVAAVCKLDCVGNQVQYNAFDTVQVTVKYYFFQEVSNTRFIPLYPRIPPWKLLLLPQSLLCCISQGLIQMTDPILEISIKL